MTPSRCDGVAAPNETMGNEGGTRIDGARRVERCPPGRRCSCSPGRSRLRRCRSLGRRPTVRPTVVALLAFLYLGVSVAAFGGVPSRRSQVVSFRDPRHPVIARSGSKPCVCFSAAADDSAEISVNEGGIYRPFAEHAWDRLRSSGLFRLEPDPSALRVPDELKRNSSPARGMPEGSCVRVEVEKAVPAPEGNADRAVRVGRYALLETLVPARYEADDAGDDAPQPLVCAPNATHVLNLVLFPEPSSGLPVFGADLVSLPGNKHLVALDFQPTLPPVEGEDARGDRSDLFPPGFEDLEEQLAALHSKHMATGKMPWGGEIPDKAKRYFSPYALWTRLGGEDTGALDVVRTEVFAAFRDYLDLYLELMERATSSVSMQSDEGGLQGQRDYLEYRRSNDPARPMLRSLYGEEWAERLIGEVLFYEI